MENQIKNFANCHKYKFIPITNEKSMEIIHNAVINNIFDDVTEFYDSVIYVYYGMRCETNNNFANAIKYYEKSSIMENDVASLYLGNIYKNKGEPQKMIMYLTLSANKPNIDAIFILGEYFYSIRNFSEMEKWFETGVSNDDERCMVNLASYYKKNNINILKMLDLFTRAAEKKSIYAINNLVDYYKNVNSIELMIKYLFCLVDLEYIDSYISLASHYQDIGDIDNMLLWLNNAITKGSVDAMINIGCYYRDIKKYDEMEKYFLMAFDKGDIDGFYQLLLEAETTKNLQKLKKYLLIGINKNDQLSIDKTNLLLESLFDIELALQCFNKNKLAINHQSNLQIFIMNYHKIKNYEQLQPNKIINETKLCGICKNEKLVSPINYSINFCHDCFENIKSNNFFTNNQKKV